MASRDPRVDAYISNSAGFAKPILKRLRALVHGVCPQVEETMKWSFPHFMHHGMLCAMAAFKQHCSFGFWKSELIVGPKGISEDSAMGQFGRITGVKDLPSDDVLAGYIRQAMQLNESNIKKLRPRSKPRSAPTIPADLAAALSRNAKTRAAFAGFSGSQQREYVEWIEEAKREATRSNRLATAVEWISEGKTRNWKYMKC